MDVAHGFAEALGVDVELVPVTSANRLQKVGRGEIDIVAATMGDTRSRRELVTMIEPQYYGDGANVLLRDDAKIGTWADLRGQTVCGLQGSLWNRLAKQRLLLDVTAFNSTREASQGLRNEHCVGWIYDEVLLLHELRPASGTDLASRCRRASCCPGPSPSPRRKAAAGSTSSWATRWPSGIATASCNRWRRSGACRRLRSCGMRVSPGKRLTKAAN